MGLEAEANWSPDPFFIAPLWKPQFKNKIFEIFM